MLYKDTFRGKEYLISDVGAVDYISAYMSFSLEHQIREEWWDVREGDVVFDVGAGFGSYTLPALAAGASLVIAAEPHRDGLFSLVSSLAVNRTAPGRCVVLPHLMCETMGEMRSFNPGSHSSTLRFGHMTLRLTDTIDSVCHDLKLTRLDWIKIDVEGAEGSVIRGALKAVAHYRPRLLIEYHEGFVPGVGDEIRAMLRPLGYAEKLKASGGINDFWGLWTYDAEHADHAAPAAP